MLVLLNGTYHMHFSTYHLYVFLLVRPEVKKFGGFYQNSLKLANSIITELKIG
jgi:hypothetical protein